MDPKNVQVVTELVKQKPKTLQDVLMLIGIVGYFRKYISDFSRKAAPLYELLTKTDENNKLFK